MAVVKEEVVEEEEEEEENDDDDVEFDNVLIDGQKEVKGKDARRATSPTVTVPTSSSFNIAQPRPKPLANLDGNNLAHVDILSLIHSSLFHISVSNSNVTFINLSKLGKLADLLAMVGLCV